MRKFITLTDRVHPVHLPHVLVETAVSQGAPREALFENSGLTPEMLTNPDMRVSFIEYGFLASNAIRLTGNPGIGLAVGRNTGLAQMGAVGFLLQNCATLGDALECSVRYSQALAPGWNFAFRIRGDVATLIATETVSTDPLRVFAHDCVLASFDTQARALVRRSLPIRRVTLPFPEPSHSAEYRKFCDAPFLFDQPETTVDFDAAILAEPLAFADPAARKLAERYCEQMYPAENLPEGLVGRVRRLLQNSPGVPPTLAELARVLQTSTRSLRRELRNMQTSYSDLVDESRRLRAEEWMRTNAMPFEMLARELGFSHVRSFRRAYKRWTGKTPAAARPRAH